LKIIRDIEQRLSGIEGRLTVTNHKLEHIMANLDKLTAAVAEVATVEASAVALIQGIAQQLKDAIAANDPAAIDALVTQLQDATAPLAAAVAANTPAAPTA
jgi:hypothetical protein